MVRIKRRWLCGRVCLYAWENVNVEASLLKRSVTFSIVGLTMIFQCCFAMTAYMKVISQVSTGKLLLSSCRNWDGRTGHLITFVAVVHFSLFATTTLPRTGFNLYTVHTSLFHIYKYISMESAEGNSYVNCFKNCLYHLFHGNVWSTSNRIGFLEGEGGFGLAADIFGWRNSNLKLHLLKKPVHNFVCFFFFPQRSWNKLPAILCSVQVSRLPFTHGRLWNPSGNWRLYLKFCWQCSTLQWPWYSYGGHLVQPQL